MPGPFAQQVAQGFNVNFVVDTGDMTTFGTPAENLVTRFVPQFGIPYVFVRGNHDSPSLAEAMARQPNVTVLDGTTTRVDGLTIYGYGDPVFNQNAQSLNSQQWVQLIQSADLPLPEFNVLVEGELVDALWRDHRVIVELDGFAFHKSRAQFESDRRRDAKLQVAGYRVLRITQQRLTNEPQKVLAEIAALLSVERAAWAAAGR